MHSAPPSESGNVEPIAQARAWYAIHYESIVDAVETVLLQHLQHAPPTVSVRSLIHGRLQILIESALLSTGSHMYIRDVGTDFAGICGGSIDALTDLRIVLERTLVLELPTHLASPLAPRIGRMLTEVIWGYAKTGAEIEVTAIVNPPAVADSAYGLDARWYEALIAQSPEAIAIFHAVSGEFLAGNERLEQMFGYSLAEFDALPNDSIYTEETPEDDFDKGVELMAGKIPSFSRETAWRHKDGHTVWCDMTSWLVRDDDGLPVYLVCAYEPLGDRENHWQRADKRFRYLAQLSVDPTFILGLDDVIRYASPATERTFGIDPAQLAGTALIDLVVPEDRVRFEELRAELVRHPGHPARREMRVNRRDGQWRWFEVTGANLLDIPEIEGFSYQARDVSDRKLVEQLLAQQALFDSLTNILNRRGMLERLDRALATATASGRQVSVMYIDLDNFKEINDRYGHQTGDEALVIVANRLTEAVGMSGIVARWGGDEFVVVLEEASEALTMAISGRITVAFEDQIRIAADQFKLGASIGLAFTAGNDQDFTAMALLRAADRALYDAKSRRHAGTHDADTRISSDGHGALHRSSHADAAL